MQEIYVDDVGTGFPLVLVHGYLGSSEMWNLQKKFLSKHFRIITPALPGFGESYKAQSLDNINLIKVETAEEMFQSTLNNLPADVAIFSAAVGDYKVKNAFKEKIKKKDNLNLELERNVDILNYISNHNSLRPKLVIGFAAETNNLEKYANEKLNEKNCDWIIANDVSNKKIGFDSDFNEVSIFYKNKNSEKLKYKPKSEISDEVVEKIINHLN